MHETKQGQNGGSEDEEEGSSGESFPVSARLLTSKFTSLANTLQETNQNLLTFEHLLDLYKTSSRASSGQPRPSSPKKNTSSVVNSVPEDNKVDIVNLLQDICGSVNDLKTEMGQSLSKEPFDGHQSKITELEEKYIQERQKNVKLEEILREQEADIRKLNVYLKDSEDYSKEIHNECHHLKKQILACGHELSSAVNDKESLEKMLKENQRSDEKLKLSAVGTELRNELAECKSLLSDSEDRNEKLLESNQELREKLNKYNSMVFQSNQHSKENTKEDVKKQSEVENEEHELGMNSPRSTISSSKSEQISESLIQKYNDLKESHKRLKQKTKMLLKQYREKRSLMERKERQLSSQRTGLMRLQTLHQSVESNHCVVIHHLGQQTVQIARLVRTLWPEQAGPPELLQAGAASKLSEWILAIDNLSSWIVNKLVRVSLVKR